MCSMLDIQAAWSAWLCWGPSGSRRNWPVVSDVGGVKPTGTNTSAVMIATVLDGLGRCTRVLLERHAEAAPPIRLPDPVDGSRMLDNCVAAERQHPRTRA